MVRWLCQPSKERRAAKYIRSTATDKEGAFVRVEFIGHDLPLYFPARCRWLDFCQTVDECFGPHNWHQFVSPETALEESDIVIDCGAAEGLFSYVAAAAGVSKVYAMEPMPIWHAALQRTFAKCKKVEILQVGLGQRTATMNMIDDEISSRISSEGTVEVAIQTLDSLFYDKALPATFIKADVEGFELPLIVGAEETIRANRPKIALAVYHDENDFNEISAFLKSIHSDYLFKTRGIATNGHPILLQAY
jgi:FkbM family methyltransferase